MLYGLSAEQDMIAQTVRSFVEKEIYPHEELVERTGEVPNEIAQHIKEKTLELGFYACNFPQSVGCAGLSHVDFALVERELGRGSQAKTTPTKAPKNGSRPFSWIEAPPVFLCVTAINRSATADIKI